MDVILPVAGLGTRLRPQTWSKPKPLVGLAGKPMLAHVLDRVMPAQPEQLVFITGYLGEQIEAWARAHYDLPMTFVEQPEMLGQTDAIIRTRDYVNDDALILFPDMIFEADFADLDQVDADAVAFTKEVEDPSAYGIAVIENDRVSQLIEKPDEPVSHLALIGIYYIKHMEQLFGAIEEQMAKGMKTKGEYFIADAVQLMIDSGAKVVTAPVAVWEDCGNAEALLSTNHYLLDRTELRPSTREAATVIQPSYVSDSAVLERAVIGPYASVGERVTVRDAVVRDAVLEDDSTVERAVVAHTVIGRGATITGRPMQINASDLSIIAL